MTKSEAIDLLGGSISSAAKAIGVSYQAIDKWPDDLPSRISDRVIAAVACEKPDDWARIWEGLSHGTSTKEANHA